MNTYNVEQVSRLLFPDTLATGTVAPHPSPGTLHE